MHTGCGAAGEVSHPALVFEEQDFAVEPPAVADERPVRPDDTVAGDNDRNGVAAVSETDRPAGSTAADLPGELGVAPGLPVLDLTERSPDPCLLYTSRCV